MEILERDTQGVIRPALPIFSATSSAEIVDNSKLIKN